MFYEYTPESEGGRLIYHFKPPHSWHGHSKTLTIGEFTVLIQQNAKDKSVVILIQKLSRIVKVISSVELEWHKDEIDDYYFPVEKSL